MNGLFNSPVLDVAIGLVLVYLLLAIITSAVNEWFARIFDMRAKMLEKGIIQLLDAQPVAPAGGAAATGDKPNGSFVDLFFKHPMMTGMCKDTKHPSYIPARTFASILMDIATDQKEGAITFDDLENGIKALPPGDVRKALLALIQNCDHDLQAAQIAIEAWFDDAMDRVSGWFKRRTQVVILCIAVVITICVNADTVHIVRQLSIDPVLRNAIVTQAKTDSQKPLPDTGSSNQFSEEDKLLLGQVLGWHNVNPKADPAQWLLRILGWILTVFAVSLGAPFWFDSLNKVVNLRSAGKVPAEKPKSLEQPAQPPAAKKE